MVNRKPDNSNEIEISPSQATVTSRREYNLAALNESNASRDPFDLFRKWFREASGAGLLEPDTMMLATVSSDGKPSLRAVLFKQLTSDGFIFYTNYVSRKGREIESNPNVALAFVWNQLEQQIRIEGQAKRLEYARNAEYFSTRPRGAQLAAVASRQSAVIASRDELEAKVQQLENEYHGKTIDCPREWGGYLVVPRLFEFWQGRENRMHDRLQFTLQGDKSWLVQRLSP